MSANFGYCSCCGKTTDFTEFCDYCEAGNCPRCDFKSFYATKWWLRNNRKNWWGYE